jgi:hypothetical protein
MNVGNALGTNNPTKTRWIKTFLQNINVSQPEKAVLQKLFTMNNALFTNFF